LAICLTNLLIIINTKASSSFNTFPEGVSFDMDSFPIAVDSGSTYCLSNRRFDFEGGSKTIKLSNANNTLIMQSAPGFHQFKAFTTNINQEDCHIACFDAHIIPDNESLVQGDHLPEDLGDPNQSTLINLTKGEPQTLRNNARNQCYSHGRIN
jgi:hypothetical protein